MQCARGTRGYNAPVDGHGHKEGSHHTTIVACITWLVLVCRLFEGCPSYAGRHPWMHRRCDVACIVEDLCSFLSTHEPAQTDTKFHSLFNICCTKSLNQEKLLDRIILLC